MRQDLKTFLTLAVVLLLLAPTMLLIEHSLMQIDLRQITLQLTILGIVYFAYTVVEIFVVRKLTQKDFSYGISANLGFSLLRLLITIALLFYFKHQMPNDFGLAFTNILVFYFIVLIFSTWVRQKDNRKIDTKL